MLNKAYSQGQTQQQTQSQAQRQTQRQVQKFSQMQIQGMKFLSMNSYDLREEILKFAQENPFVKIVAPKRAKSGSGSDDFSGISNFSDFNDYSDYSDFSAGAAGSDSSASSQKLQSALENIQSYEETLQSHLLHQLNSMNLTPDEQSLSEKLIYNLDENGFYGSQLSPEFLLDRTRPAQNAQMLRRCLERIQQLDPVGTCCKGPEESLLIQAKQTQDAPELALFLLDGHLELLNPAEPAVILKKLVEYRQQWHKQAFAGQIILDTEPLTQETVSKALQFILTLNPRPAQDYDSDSYAGNQVDVVVTIQKVLGKSAFDDWSRGIVSGGSDFYFQIKYASGILPEVRLVSEAFLQGGAAGFSKEPKKADGAEGAISEGQTFENFRKDSLQKAESFINGLAFRESSIILQACAIVSKQKSFFENGTGPINPLTHRQIAQLLGIHESSVSRTANKKSSKYFQTQWGLFPASYFFSSAINATTTSGKISSAEVKNQILKILKSAGTTTISDQKIVEHLAAQGIKISRRTVNKYRNQLGIENSYKR